jgi:hypothetical protein
VLDVGLLAPEELKRRPLLLPLRRPVTQVGRSVSGLCPKPLAQLAVSEHGSHPLEHAAVELFCHPVLLWRVHSRLLLNDALLPQEALELPALVLCPLV